MIINVSIGNGTMNLPMNAAMRLEMLRKQKARIEAEQWERLNAQRLDPEYDRLRQFIKDMGEEPCA
jgi:hypothetical protein